MSETETELKPCFFCEEAGGSVEAWGAHDIHAVVCSNCGASGPESDTYEGAIKAWNTRASDSRRCGDCVHFDAEFRDDCQWCRALDHAADPDFFCADFTKREDK